MRKFLVGVTLLCCMGIISNATTINGSGTGLTKHPRINKET